MPLSNVFSIESGKVMSLPHAQGFDRAQEADHRIASRIDAIGVLHKVLSTEPREAITDLGEHLSQMCLAMRPFVSLTAPVELCCDSGPDCVVPVEDVVPIALIVSEMVTNAVKYAHP